MKVRVVALPLLATLCLAAPAWASPADAADEQRRRDRGGDNRGGNNRGGDNRGGDTRRYDRPTPRPRVAIPRRPDVTINIGRGPRYYAPSQYDRWARQNFRWSPVRYVPWGLIYGSVGAYGAYGAYGAWGAYGPGAYGAYGAPYYRYPSYGYASGYDTGGIRLRIRPRDAQVFVNGYYAGLVDDFDGTFQQLRLEPGGHKIEVRLPGFEDLEMDVHVQPGRTIDIREDLRPRP